MTSAFKPFLAYELIDIKMAEKLHDAMCEHRVAVDDFVESEEVSVEKARRVMESLERIEHTYNGISNEIYRVPSIVHLAGEAKEESNPDNPEETATVQRCSRCGSMLQFWFDGIMYLTYDGRVRNWEENDTHWWEVGQQIAKSDITGATDLYEIDDGQKLERWETECADLSELEASFEEA